VVADEQRDGERREGEQPQMTGVFTELRRDR
jgi:hypothetical protein